MIVQVKPRTPEDAPMVSYPNVSRVWYLPGRIALSFRDAEGIDRVFPLVEHEVQIIDEPR
jgi:hypothetical protein